MDKGSVDRGGSGIFSDRRGGIKSSGGGQGGVRGGSSLDKRGGGPNTIWVSNNTYSRLLNGFLWSIFTYLLFKVIYFSNGYKLAILLQSLQMNAHSCNFRIAYCYF